MVRVHPDPPVYCDDRRHSALSERLPTDVGVALLRLDWLDPHNPLTVNGCVFVVDQVE
jgi:hypothetical protein